MVYFIRAETEPIFRVLTHPVRAQTPRYLILAYLSLKKSLLHAHHDVKLLLYVPPANASKVMMAGLEPRPFKYLEVHIFGCLLYYKLLHYHSRSCYEKLMFFH